MQLASYPRLWTLPFYTCGVSTLSMCLSTQIPHTWRHTPQATDSWKTPWIKILYTCSWESWQGMLPHLHTPQYMEQTGRAHGGTESTCREAVFCCTAAWQRLSKGKPVWLSSLAYCVELNPGPSSTLFFLTVTWLQAWASLFLMFLTGFTFREASARLKSRVELGPRKLTYLNFTLIYKTR